jgi:hypothetical protein
MTSHTESYSLVGGVRPHGWVMYSSERLNSKQGIVSFWYKPNRNGKSSTQMGRMLFIWGDGSTNTICIKLDDTN